MSRRPHRRPPVRVTASLLVLLLGWLLLWSPAPAATLDAAAVAASGIAHQARSVAELVGLATPRDTDGAAPAAVVRQVARARAASAGSGGALTVAGHGTFAGLSVTVSKVKDLVNETVSVTWSGARPTKDKRAFDADYLQIMQCWGDDPSGPDRSQCQFGGRVGVDDRGGANAASRHLVQPTYRDGADPLVTGAGSGDDPFVPFRAVTGETVTGKDTLKNPFYDASSTNEITYARTRGDGTGQEFLEVQTYLEAPGLGCGKVTNGRPRPCWLVVVPRGDTEVDGTPWETVFNTGSHRLDSSPLSLSNWDNRIIVPLSFAAGGSLCSIDAAQRPVVGVEDGIEAVTRWQPALCRNRGPVFSYSQVADSVAERQLLSDEPGLALLQQPLDPDSVPSDRTLVYAPITVSALTFGVQIERQSPAEAPDSARTRDGERITEVNLTPRLVAKLLTQSYLWSVRPTARYLKANPDNITQDPDFLAVNPQFASLSYTATIDVLVPLGNGRGVAAVWEWIGQDQDALDFIAGLPDPWGMRINPFYQGMDVARDDLPKVDPYCDKTIVKGAPALCTLDAHPYAQDLREGTRSAARGDALARTSWDSTADPPAWKKAAAQLSGERRVLALSDTPLAARYQLVNARLRNASGRFVAPTAAGMAAGVAAMRPSGVPGVALTDPASTSRTAYPLTVVTYAAAAPSKLTAGQARDYASFLRYAAGAGQVLGIGQGQLPEGYQPLNSVQRKALLAMASVVAARKGGPAPSGPIGSGGVGATPVGQPGAGAVPSPGKGAVATATPSVAPPTAAPTTTAVAVASATSPTPASPVGLVRNVLSLALLLGVAGTLLGPALPRLARRLRKGAEPTSVTESPQSTTSTAEPSEVTGSPA